MNRKHCQYNYIGRLSKTTTKAVDVRSVYSSVIITKHVYYSQCGTQINTIPLHTRKVILVIYPC